MSITLKINKTGLFFSRIIPVAAILFFAAIAVFCVFYLFTGYYHLINWFNGLNCCFYRHANWTNDFFNGKTKEAGNIYCLIALLLCIIGGWYVIRSLIKKRKKIGSIKKLPNPDLFIISVSAIDAALSGVLILITTIMWFYGTSLVYPSNDEVFSAVNCASLHPFQTIAYYMLPNNHILFNLINNLFFHYFTDKVATGRFISLVCYWGIALTSFAWLRNLFHKRWLAFLVAVTLLLQFPVWGFATQARGYELLLLVEWGVIICLFRYYFKGQKRWLYIISACCIAGYFTVPTFLYFHLAIILFSFFCQLKNKKADFLFWKFQMAIVFIVFLLYLPCLCFSGMSSIIGNKYVTPYQDNKEFIADFIPVINNYLDYSFFNFITSNHQVDGVLFLLPLALFFYTKSKTAVFMSRFYFSVWLAILFLTFRMRIFPIDRALAGQFSITLVIVIYTVYLLAGTVADRLKIKVLSCILLSLFLVSISFNFILNGRIHINHYLCHFPVNAWHDLMEKGIKTLPNGSSAAFSDESFYLYYLSTQKGLLTTKCSTANEDYFINLNEPFPAGIAEHFEAYNTVGDFYIYKRKDK